MKESIRERVLEGARLIAATGMTVRAAARKLGVSKSTVHKDMEARRRARIFAVCARPKGRPIRPNKPARRTHKNPRKGETACLAMTILESIWARPRSTFW